MKRNLPILKIAVAVILLAIGTSACEKDDGLSYPGSISIGQRTGEGIFTFQLAQPDTVVGDYNKDPGEVAYDLNCDGQNDVVIRSKLSGSPAVQLFTANITPLCNNAILVLDTGDNLAASLVSGEVIDATGRWHAGPAILNEAETGAFSNPQQTGLWWESVGRFLGVRIDLGSGNYGFAWIRMDAYRNSFTVHEFAATIGY